MKLHNISLTDPRLRRLGRVALLSDGLAFDWSLSGIEFAVRGSRIEATITSADIDDIHCTYVAVEIDGHRTTKFRLKSGMAVYTLADDLPTDHITRLRLCKLNEGAFAWATLNALAIDGCLCASPPAKPKTLEVIGDSISAGYGVLSTNAMDPFRAETEDAVCTYGALLAEMLNAELLLTAVSGCGICRNNDGSTHDTIIEQYDRLRPGVDPLLCWNHRLVHPDVILLNLGTNDNAAEAPPEEVRTAVTRLADRLHRLHPHAKMLWVYGLMNQDYKDSLRAAVEQVASAHIPIQFVLLPQQQEFSDIVGSDGHPSRETHRQVAHYLLPYLRPLFV